MKDWRLIEDKLIKKAQESLETFHVPGCIIGIFTANEVKSIISCGLNNVSLQKKMESDLVFPVGSCEKSFTAFLIGKLVEEGQIDWEEPLKKFFPDFQLEDDYATQHMCISDILSHKTGITKNQLLWGFSEMSKRDLYQRLRGLECIKNYNYQYNYNNNMYSVAEYLIERITNMSYADAIRHYILEPLNMESMFYGIDKCIKKGHRIHNYQYYDDKYHEVDYSKGGNIHYIKEPLFGMMKDIITWCQLFLNYGKYGEKELIQKSNIMRLITPQTIIPCKKDLLYAKDKSYMFYGMGWYVQDYRGRIMLNHNGTGLGSGMYLSYMPDEGIGIAISCNRVSDRLTQVLAYNLYDQVVFDNELPWLERYKQLEDKKIFYPTSIVGETKIPQAEATRFIGNYLNDTYGSIEVKMKDNGLLMYYYSLEVKLQRMQETIFCGIPTNDYVNVCNKLMFMNCIRVVFSTDLNGKIERLYMENEIGAKDIEFKKID